MLFRRNKDKAEASPATATAPEPTPAAAAVVPAPFITVPAAEPRAAAAVTLLDADQLGAAVDGKTLGFKTTAELEPLADPLGQDAAVAALTSGLAAKGPATHVFLVAAAALGPGSLIAQALAERKTGDTQANDVVYVENFEDRTQARALVLPAGQGRRFAQAVRGVVEELAATLPAAFSGDVYESRRRMIEEEHRLGQDGGLEALRQKAFEQNIAILRTPGGYGVAPMHGGRVVRPEIFKQLPGAMQSDVKARVAALETELAALLAAAPARDRERLARIAELDAEVGEQTVRAALAGVEADFAKFPAAKRHLEDLERALGRNLGLFVGPDAGARRLPRDVADQAGLARFLANVAVERGAQRAAPIVIEDDVTPGLLTGGAGTAFAGTASALGAGALHRANGGVLVLDCASLLAAPLEARALGRALAHREIEIRARSGMACAEPVPLDVKVVLVGDACALAGLNREHPALGRQFGIVVRAATEIPARAEAKKQFARLVAALLERAELKPIDSDGMAWVIERAMRRAGGRDRIALGVDWIGPVAALASVGAGDAGRKTIGREDLVRAARLAGGGAPPPASGAADRFAVDDAESAKVGQVVALEAANGSPLRIEVRASAAAGGAPTAIGLDTARDGALALLGFLGGRFAQQAPLSVAAQVTADRPRHERSGCPAAALAGLLSALAEAPVRQDFAVQGSVNQAGELIAAPHLNEAVEAFFEACSTRGLSGTQGVVVPRAALDGLLLGDEVVGAVRQGKFALHAAASIDQVMELLTGLKAGERRADGLYPAGTVNRLVEDKLNAFAEAGRKRSAAGANGKATA